MVHKWSEVRDERVAGDNSLFTGAAHYRQLHVKLLIEKAAAPGDQSVTQDPLSLTAPFMLSCDTSDAARRQRMPVLSLL